MSPKRVLIVDDDPWICRMVGTMLQKRGHTVESAQSGKEGLALATSFRPHLVITDVLMSDELSVKKNSRRMEQALIRRALERTGGNRTAAAKILELSHRALLYKIKEYGID